MASRREILKKLKEQVTYNARGFLEELGYDPNSWEIKVIKVSENEKLKVGDITFLYQVWKNKKYGCRIALRISSIRKGRLYFNSEKVGRRVPNFPHPAIGTKGVVIRKKK
jgi:hypothetical protein